MARCPEYTQLTGERHECIHDEGHDPEKQPHEAAPVLSDEGREVTLSWWESWPPSWDGPVYGTQKADGASSTQKGQGNG